jgi:hypothetical protein
MVLQYSAFGRQTGALASPITRGHITFLESFQSTAIDPVSSLSTFNTNANGVDALFFPK